MTEAREARLAHNESVFRTVNESINGIAIALGGDQPYEFICECSTSDCFERLVLTLAEYEHVRADGAYFLLAAGHEDIEVELVVETHDAYVIVEKDGVAGLAAHDADPRA
ncbi:MAG: hypothetical protein H0X39_06880 [Actinobacteria bacterium]|nr:hypothetical protein [Actinomycetota bacterium]